MAKDRIEIEVIAKGLEKVEQDIKDLTKSTKGMKQQSGSAFDFLKSGWFKVAAAAGTAMAAIKKSFDLSKEAARFEQSMQAAEKQFGKSGKEILKTLKAVSGGTIANADLITAANKTMALNVTQDLGQMAKLLEVARIRAQAMRTDTTEAFSDITTGIGRMSPLILDNLGIITKGWAEEAKAAGVAFDQQFILNKVLEDGAKIIDKAGGITLTSAEKLQKFTVAVKNNALSFGQKLLPAVTNVTDKITDLITDGDDLSTTTETLTGLYKDYQTALKNTATEVEGVGKKQKALNELQLINAKIRLFDAISSTNKKYKEQKDTVKDLNKDIEVLNRQVARNKKFVDDAKAANQDYIVTAQGFGDIPDTIEKLTTIEARLADQKLELIRAEEDVKKEQEKTKQGIIDLAQASIFYKDVNVLALISNQELKKEVIKTAKAIKDGTLVIEDDTDEIKKNADAKKKAAKDGVKATADAAAKELAIRQEAIAAAKQLVSDFYSFTEELRQNDLAQALAALETERNMALDSGAAAEIRTMDEEDHQRRIENLSKEAAAAAKAGDSKLSEEKKREIARLQLEEQAKAEELKINEEFNKKIADEKTKAAKREKKANIIQSLINTALAVTSTLAQAPGGAISKGVQAAIVGGLGAVQTLFIAAQPTPQFAQGTGFSPAGTALVGERGPELVNLPQGSQVIPNSEINNVSNDNSNININIQTNDPIEFVNTLSREYGLEVFGAS
jgi:hypothetical protein